MSDPKKWRKLLTKIGVSQASIANHCDASAAAISRLVNRDDYGVGLFAHNLRLAVRDYLISQGADPAELDSLIDLINRKPFKRSPRHQSPTPQVQGHFNPEEISAMDDSILEFFQLENNPFPPARITSERDVLRTNEHARLVSRVVAAAEHAELLVVIGEHGCGKSTSIRAAEPILLDRNIVFCKFMASDVPKHESVVSDLVKAMFDALELPPRQLNQQRRLEAIKKHLHTNGLKLAVLIDDGHTLHPQTLLAIKRRYDALSFGFNQLVAFIILSQPYIYSDLARGEMAEFKGHIDRYEVAGLLSADEVDKYVGRKLRRYAELNHCDVSRWIDPDAAERIWSRFAASVSGLRFKDPQISPRRLNEICISLFERAYNLGESRITAAVVDNYADHPAREL